MKILITGGAGFIGGYLARSLSDDHEVFLCDLPNHFSINDKKNFQCIECDISKASSLKNLPKVDVVYHLAAQSGTASAIKNLNKDLSWNAQGTLNVVQYVLEHDIKKMCFTSSMAVYGNAVDADESCETKPTSPYGISKLCAENYVNYLKRVSPDVHAVIFRIFNCYGPGQDTKNQTQGIASIFMEQIDKGNRIEVTGDLSRRRDLIYIDDVVSALKMFLVDEMPCGTYNLCSNESVDISSLIDMIGETSEKNIDDLEKINIGGVVEDPFIVTGNSKKLMCFGWTPKTSLINGLKQCWSKKRVNYDQ